MPRIMPEPRYFSIPSTVVGGMALRNRARNCTPWVRSLLHSPLAWMNSPAEIVAVANHGDQIALSPRLDAEDAEAILVIVERHPFHKTGESFRRGVSGRSQTCAVNSS